ncbi:MAG: hypothetical protein PHQ86_00680 [Dehalococcoidales bacterium]|nr:hypothetical protein [Dehalococcoidales bacterium]
MYNPLNKEKGVVMPQFYKFNWQCYDVDIIVGDNLRKLTRLITGWCLFKKDALPYLNQVPLYFDCTITPPTNIKSSDKINYEWRLLGVEDGKIYTQKRGVLDIVPNEKTRIKLVSDVIQRTIQYTGEIRFSTDELDKEQWQLFVSLTVLDKDIYSMEKIMTRLADFIWFIIGIGLTILIQKIFGVI